VPWVEAAITASVVVLGLLVALNVRLPTLPAAALVGLFAVFHGVSHGAEMPAMADPLAYGLGFLLATAALHASGIWLGTGLSRLDGPVLSRAAGAATVGAGVVLAFAG
jgi:urease accessory protein